MKKKIKQWVLNKRVIATYKWGRQDDQKDGGIDLNQRYNRAVMQNPSLCLRHDLTKTPIYTENKIHFKDGLVKLRIPMETEATLGLTVQPKRDYTMQRRDLIRKCIIIRKLQCADRLQTRETKITGPVNQLNI